MNGGVDMNKKLQFRIKELMAEKERKTGVRCSYRIIHQHTKISTNTLSTLATGKVSKVGISVIERLLDYFECSVADLIVYE